MVDGRISQVALFESGCKLTVDDGSGPAAVWLPKSLYDRLADPSGWNVGAEVRVAGRIQEYKGEAEVVPSESRDLELVERAVPAREADVRIGDLSAADVGRRVTVEATVVLLDPFSAGVKCRLDDGSGQITLLLWQEVFESVSDREPLASGARVRVTGLVDEYRGELEVIPGLGFDVVVLN
jgi:DNA/RNA endonuclease YhcR with UshA esterase domain